MGKIERRKKAALRAALREVSTQGCLSRRQRSTTSWLAKVIRGRFTAYFADEQLDLRRARRHAV
jgi:hypothetical protein